MPSSPFDHQASNQKLSNQLEPWQRSFHFWTRAIDIYTGYKFFQLRARFVSDAEKREAMWERQHELAADKVYNLCYDLGGFFLKAAQVLGKPDLAPAAWVKRLVTLCDDAPATPFRVVSEALENELGKKVSDVFERFDEMPLGSASIAQVHRARLKGGRNDVVVKIQHPGVERLMMTDIRNVQALALYMQKTDIKFDLFSISKEIEKQISHEFDFTREARAMEKIRQFLYNNNKRSPVFVPKLVGNMATRTMLVMEFIDGIPIHKLGDEISKRGLNPQSRIAMAAKQKILKSLTLAYGQMILKSGFFHADPHPGNILICKGSEVGLLDYGQVKDLPNALRLAYAKLVIALADDDVTKTTESFRELGIETLSKRGNDSAEMMKLARSLFDTKMPADAGAFQPFSDSSSLKKIAVQTFPEELFSVLRTMQLLRGLSVGMGVNYSCADQWRPLALEALRRSQR